MERVRTQSPSPSEQALDDNLLGIYLDPKDSQCMPVYWLIEDIPGEWRVS